MPGSAAEDLGWACSGQSCLEDLPAACLGWQHRIEPAVRIVAAGAELGAELVTFAGKVSGSIATGATAEVSSDPVADFGLR